MKTLLQFLRVPKDKKVEGNLTAFSLFSEYGVEYPQHTIILSNKTWT